MMTPERIAEFRETARDCYANELQDRCTECLDEIERLQGLQITHRRLAAVLVASGIVHRMAVEDPEGFDSGETLAQVKAAAEELNKP